MILEILPALTPPDYLLVSGGAPGDVTFVAPPRATRHVRHLGKYADHPVLDRQLARQTRKTERRAAGDSAPLLRAALVGLLGGLIEP